MKVARAYAIAALVMGLIGAGFIHTASARDTISHPASRARLAASENYARLPLSFEANFGQTDPRVRFLSRGPDYTLFLTPTEAVFSSKSAVLRIALKGIASSAQIEGLNRLPGRSNYFIGNEPNRWRTNVPSYGEVELKNIYPGINLVYYESRQGELEYDFRLSPGADPAAIRLSFKGDNALRLDRDGNLVVSIGDSKLVERAPAIYQVTGDKKRAIAGRWVLNGADEASLWLERYDRHRPLVIDPALVYSTYLGGSGQTYNGIAQSDRGNSIAVDSSGNAYVAGETYSADFPVTSGAVQTDNKALANHSSNVFIAKFNPTHHGSESLVYSTYLGGSGSINGGDSGNGVAVDASGDAFVTGEAFSPNFPVTPDAIQTANHAAANEGDNVFVTKLDPSGSALIYSTYLGGSGSRVYGYTIDWFGDSGNAIALDSSGNAYVTGSSYSSDFPTTAGAFQTINRAIGQQGGSVFVTKLNSSGSALIYSSYLGGSGGDIGDGTDWYGNTGNGIAVDSSGNAYVTGSAYAIDKYTCGDPCVPFPTTPGAFQNVNDDFYGNSAFMAKFDPSKTGSESLVYSSFIGGGLDDVGEAIAVDSSGDAYVTGWTFSTDFPTTPDAFDAVKHAAPTLTADAFVAKFDPSQEGNSSLIYSTFLGGTSNGLGDGDTGQGIAIDASGDAYVTGQTASIDNASCTGQDDQNTCCDGLGTGSCIPFPTTAGAFQTVNNASADGSVNAFVTKLNPTASALIYSTYLGGSIDDFANAIAIDSAGNAYIAGVARSIGNSNCTARYEPYSCCSGVGTGSCIHFPTTSGAFQVVNNTTERGGDNAFFAKLSFPGGAGATLKVSKSLSFPTQQYADGATNNSRAVQISVLKGKTAGAVLLGRISATPADYELKDDPCSGTTIGPGGTCIVMIEFQPTKLGERPGTLTIPSDASNGTVDVNLNGTAVAPSLKIDPAALNFGRSAPETPVIKKFNLIDKGKVQMNVTSLVVSLDTADFPPVTPPACATPLTPGVPCTVTVEFDPASAGKKEAMLTIYSDAAPAAVKIKLVGVGE